jgi:cell division protein FtsA
MKIRVNFSCCCGASFIDKEWQSRCIQSSGIELSGLTLEPLASDAVLSQEEKSWCCIEYWWWELRFGHFKDGIIRHTAVIPFGEM